MLELIERTREYLRGKTEKKTEAFDELVKSATDNAEALAPAEIDEALARSGKTLDDLQAALEYRQNRMALAAELATMPALQADADAAGQDLLRERARWQKAVDEHNAIEVPLTSRLIGLGQKIALAKGCGERLIAAYRGPLLEELKQISAERRQIAMRREQLENLRDQHKEWAQPNSRIMGGSKHRFQSDHDIEAHRRAIVEYDEQLAGLRARLAALADREAAIQLEMAKP